MLEHVHHPVAPSGGWVSQLFEVFAPRSLCMNYESDVIALHLISDMLISIAYFSIPVALIYFSRRRRDLVFPWIFSLFALFIVLCGSTHVFNIVALWYPLYRIDGLVKLLTGLVSILTAGLLWRLMPHALSLPGAEELRRNKEHLERLVQARTQELLQANRQIADREANFRQLAESIAQLAWMAHADGHIFWYNQRWYDYTGTTPEEMEGWGWQKVHDETMLPTVLDRWKDAIRTSTFFEMVFPLRGADGGFRRFLTRIVPFFDAERKVSLWFGTNTDIEDQIRADEDRIKLLAEAETARADAEAANRMKDEFLAVLSHELRTPLNAIVGWVKILRSGQADAEDVHEGLEVIDRNAAVQAQLIEDLLDVSRIISGKLRLDVQRVDLIQVIEEALASLMPAAEAKSLRLTKVLDPLAGPVSGDPARLQQIVWNLVSNAVKFTPRGGSIRLLLERVNSHVEVSVIDTGQGIGPDFLPHVFERFRQGDSTTTRRFGGLGLGLAIVKQLVEMHGGDIKAKSPGVGQGSTFVLSLPLSVIHEPVPPKRDSQENQSSSRYQTKEMLKGLKVLIVDDEPDSRDLVSHVLRRSAADVTTASSVREAMAQIRLAKPDILVSDVGMPEEDGYELLRQVRATMSASDLPAAALTAFVRAEDRKRALLAGFQTHVAKPVDPSELVAVVASLAGRTGGP